ncbi:MAG TPA: hypothetical protein VNO33_14560 [Kofleriaceae bacterium]|nr:hypothetical protein [Kofleriaceae bacterium]
MLAVALLAVSPAAAQSAEKGVFGAGLIVGEPTGVSGKYYLSDDRAIDMAIGGAIIGRGIQVHADFLWHPWLLDQKESFALPVYLGVGGRILNHDGGGDEDDHLRLGVRAPVGILFDFTRIPLDVFAEVAGVLDYRTSDGPFALDINGGIGARYYF